MLKVGGAWDFGLMRARETEAGGGGPWGRERHTGCVWPVLLFLTRYMNETRERKRARNFGWKMAHKWNGQFRGPSSCPRPGRCSFKLSLPSFVHFLVHAPGIRIINLNSSSENLYARPNASRMESYMKEGEDLWLPFCDAILTSKKEAGISLRLLGRKKGKNARKNMKRFLAGRGFSRALYKLDGRVRQNSFGHR